MFTRIVVGTDGSDTAREAVRQAIDLARSVGAELHIVSAYAPVPERRVRGEQSAAPADVQHEIGPREDVNLVLDAAAAEARREGIDVQTHPVEADPPDAILNVAEQVKADLIVVGNKRDDRGPPLPDGQRAQQRLPSRPLQRPHRPHHLRARQAIPAVSSVCGPPPLLLGQVRKAEVG